MDKDGIKMTREILEPRWANDSKTKVHCVFKYDDGRVLKAIVQDTAEGNPDWKEIFEKYSTDELDKNTEQLMKRIDQVQREKERAETLKNESIFNAKLEAFTIEEIKNSKNTKLKSKIRRAKSMMEVTAYTSLLLMLEYEKNKKEESSE